MMKCRIKSPNEPENEDYPAANSINNDGFYERFNEKSSDWRKFFNTLQAKLIRYWLKKFDTSIFLWEVIRIIYKPTVPSGETNVNQV